MTHCGTWLIEGHDLCVWFICVTYWCELFVWYFDMSAQVVERADTWHELYVGHDSLRDMTHVCSLYVWLMCVTYLCDMSHWYVWHNLFAFIAWLTRVTHSYVWHVDVLPQLVERWNAQVASICVIRLIRMCDMTHSYVWHDSFVCVTCRCVATACCVLEYTGGIHVCDMTHSYMWYASFIHTCDMSMCRHSLMSAGICLWHALFKHVTWLIHTCDMTHMYKVTHAYVWHDSFIRVTWLIHMFDKTSLKCVTWLIHTCDMTHAHVCHDLLICTHTHIPIHCER